MITIVKPAAARRTVLTDFAETARTSASFAHSRRRQNRRPNAPFVQRCNLRDRQWPFDDLLIAADVQSGIRVHYGAEPSYALCAMALPNTPSDEYAVDCSRLSVPAPVHSYRTSPNPH